MHKIISIIQTDFRNIFRDKSLFFVLFVPPILIALLRFGIPQVYNYFPIISSYYIPLVAFACILSATFPAYIMAFVMMDEKDQKLFGVFKILPFSFSKFIFYRLGMVCIFAFSFVLVMLGSNTLMDLSLSQVLILSLIISLEAPLVQLFVLSFAHNKIEGLTMFKLVNMFLILPVLGWFIKSAWLKLMMILPVYWTYKAFSAGNSVDFYVSIVLSIVLHLAFIFMLYKRLKNKIN